MIKAEELLSIKETYKDKETQLARLNGQLDNITEQSKKLGYSSFEDAQKALKIFKKKRKKLHELYDKKMADFKEKFPELI